MPVYNREDYVSAAIKSILYQTYSNFEFIIIDDGSTDNTPHILRKYQQSDDRIKVITNKKNSGLIPSLYKGVKISKGDYIARMDSDDISLQERFEKQVLFLENHPEIGVLGTWFAWINQDGKVSLPKNQRPTGSNLIWWGMFTFPQVVHSSVMARREIFSRFNRYGQEEAFIHAEDHAFWLRIGFESRFENFPGVLFHIRSHPGRITSSSNETQQCSSKKAIQRGLFLALNEKVELDTIADFISPVSKTSTNHKRKAIDLWIRLYRWFKGSYKLDNNDKKTIRRALAYRMWCYFQTSKNNDIGTALLALFSFFCLVNPFLDTRYWINIGTKKIRFINEED